jgi:hypothetical protein
MRALSTPEIDAEELYLRISRARKVRAVRDRLDRAKSTVFSAYESYVDTATAVCRLKPAAAAPATPKDLQGNYQYLTQSGRDVRSALLQNNPGGRCPLCDQGRATTLDHYLPQSLFPEFSILPLNLVPACGDCNRNKSATYAQADVGLFLHAYLDQIPDSSRFLFADVWVESRIIAVEFRVKPPRSLSTELRRRIVTHYEELDLAALYRVEAVNEISERSGRIKGMVHEGTSLEDVSDYLHLEAKSIASAKGHNHWRYALLDAMAQDDDICAGAFDSGEDF